MFEKTLKWCFVQREQSEVDNVENESSYCVNSALYFDACNACTDALMKARCAMDPNGINSFNLPREVSENIVTEYSLPNQTPASHTASTEIIRLLRFVLIFFYWDQFKVNLY